MQIGEGLTCMKCSCEAVILALQIASLATGREILVAFWPKNCPQKRSQSAQLFFQGEHAPDPPSLLTLMLIIAMALPV